MTRTGASLTPVDALQAALAAEHAALHVYGVLGGRLSGYDDAVATSTRALVGAAYAIHRGRRDQLRTMVRGLGGDPVVPEVGYTLGTPALTVAQIRREAREVEDACSAVYAQAVASTVGDERRWAADALTEAAVRGLGFSARPTAYPGLPELQGP